MTGPDKPNNTQQDLGATVQPQSQTTERQPACCIWLTGLSGSGKSTIANLLQVRLKGLGRLSYVLDGDNIRRGISRDLGFNTADRIENIRRVSEIAWLMCDAGLITIVSLISPFRAERQLARAKFEPGRFLEIFVDTPLEVCERRDVKGLYRKARAGLIADFTGLTSPYEAPEAPDLHLTGADGNPATQLELITAELRRRKII